MSRLFQTNNPKTSNLLKAKQYAAATALQATLIVIMMFVSRQWGYLTFGEDKVTFAFIIYNIKNLVLLFLIIDLITSIHHFYVWNKDGRPKSEDDNASLFSDWRSGERSPVKISLALLICLLLIMAAAVILQF